MIDEARLVVEALRRRGETLATAESCTGGMIAGAITDIPGASEVFGYGWVTYANEAKASELGVDIALLNACGAVSEPVARAMAEGACRKSGAHWAIAVTGIAGPGGGTLDKPVGTVYIAHARRDGATHCACVYHPSTRDEFRQYVICYALKTLLRLFSEEE